MPCSLTCCFCRASAGLARCCAAIRSDPTSFFWERRSREESIPSLRFSLIGMPCTVFVLVKHGSTYATPQIYHGHDSSPSVLKRLAKSSASRLRH
ncbi:hypothetical protein SCLCIDRAFT_1211149 [Scleroderma citrinum Foug A]|uniref:Uncharacterized protein n=1 Tax=Scleroderma citrinum Foug A TaxID=1036808 RepID=A0A0C2ZY86_9AGAM|nr:hypothetical protein SCLCIDRAFT_1211149 [Scleroderma citrinum Foug A]